MAGALSSIGLGGYELGDTDLERGVEVIAAAKETGVDWVDTAEAYYEGGNESLIGAAIARTGPMAVSTKVAPFLGGFRPEQIHASCRASLSRLGLEHVELYFLHERDASGVPLEETWGAMAELVEEGLVSRIGLSNFSLDEITTCDGMRHVDVIQDGLSMLDYLDNRELFAAAADRGIAGVVYEPLANGLLTGAIDRSTDPDTLWDGQLKTQWPTLFDRLFGPGRFERSLDVAEGAAELSGQWGLTVAQAALAWCAHQPGVTSVLAGTSNPAHARSNGAVHEVALTDEQLRRLDALIPLGPSG